VFRDTLLCASAADSLGCSPPTLVQRKLLALEIVLAVIAQEPHASVPMFAVGVLTLHTFVLCLGTHSAQALLGAVAALLTRVLCYTLFLATSIASV
jgi:hypothetical protein